MAKFYGAIGYALQQETVPGVWENSVIERTYRGDVTLSQFRWQASENFNDNLNVDNALSILADDFAYEHLENIVYVVWHGSKWKVQSFSIKRPRLVLQIGGLYNE